eukprot:CAMPEP_0185026914 /NCGR_PEP_ID=MMETSP1103-20130426/11531_1 /TAXON_ID=36769 /ORGANISM="Paraphysomonas bandaiensis, Strain Caron Lab Isolate" /LENGTH=60 /DNA_ID=CAMNT_0027560671 /DNA_START=379 /DNA_END=561 /DNA_ORIENTATION=-
MKSSYPANRNLPERENATLVIPDIILSLPKVFNAFTQRISKSLQVWSSDPVPTAWPSGKK